MNLQLATAVIKVGGGSAIIQSLLIVLIVGLCAGILWWVGKYFITKLQAPPMAMTVWNGFFILIGAIVIINFLLSLIGYQFIGY